MAVTQQWADFIGLAEMDAAESDDRGSYARDMLAAMANYMEARLTVRDVRLLVDLVMDDDVRAAVVGGIAAQASAQAAIEAAAQAVAVAVGE